MDERQIFWDSRAGMGFSAGTNDIILKQMEMKAISSRIRDGMSILDFGCGNGITAVELAKQFNVSIIGIDFSNDMIDEAEKYAKAETVSGRTRFLVGDNNTISFVPEKFDCIYTERAIINLKSWSEQTKAIRELGEHLKPSGVYLMCECSQDGFQSINELRDILDLEPINMPWHNRYLRDSEIESLSIAGLSLESIDPFTSSYYFLSRVINAALAKMENRIPQYDAPINTLALKLPSIGTTAQVKIWVWRKEN